MKGLALLKARYASPAYVFLAEVGNATGYRTKRHADGFAVSIWPSRGLHFIGFEIKSIRSDWTKEMKTPEKAEEIAKYCHYWYLVCESDDVAKVEEIPATWGFMVVRDGKLVTLKEPVLMTPQSPTVAFVAAVMRKWAEHTVPKSMLDEEITKGRALIEARVKDAQSSELKRANEETDRLRTVIRNFETASGLRIDGGMWINYELPAIGKAVKVIMDQEQWGLKLNGLERAERELASQHEAISQAIQQLKAFGDKRAAIPNEQSITGGAA